MQKDEKEGTGVADDQQATAVESAPTSDLKQMLLEDQDLARDLGIIDGSDSSPLVGSFVVSKYGMTPASSSVCRTTHLVVSLFLSLVRVSAAPKTMEASRISLAGR